MPTRQGWPLAAERGQFARVDEGMLHAMFLQGGFGPVGGIALGDAVERHRHTGAMETDETLRDFQPSPIDQFHSRGDFDAKRSAAFSRSGFMQLPKRLNSDIELAASLFGQLLSGLQHFH